MTSVHIEAASIPLPNDPDEEDLLDADRGGTPYIRESQKPLSRLPSDCKIAWGVLEAIQKIQGRKRSIHLHPDFALIRDCIWWLTRPFLDIGTIQALLLQSSSFLNTCIDEGNSRHFLHILVEHRLVLLHKGIAGDTGGTGGIV